MRNFFFAIALTCAATAGWGFSIEEERVFGADSATRDLSIISSTDIDVFAPLIEAFLAVHPETRVRYVVTNTTELYQALAAGTERFDLAISSAMDLQMKLANDGIAQAHRSDAARALPAWAHWQDQLFAFAQEPVVLAISKEGFRGLREPRTRADLIEVIRANPERFRGRIGTYNPNLSGAGYMFATQDARQSETYWRLNEVIGRVDPVLYSSTSAMIDDLQSGRILLAYNVLGSYASGRLADWADGALIEFRDFTHVLLRTALIPRNAERPDEGRVFLDFLLSEAGQSMIATETDLPPLDGAALANQPHLRPIRLDAGLLVFVDPLKRQKFLNEWTSAVVQP